MPFLYVDHTMNPTPVERQVSYGPTADLTVADQGRLQARYGTPDVLARVTQYGTRHATYVAAARATGRPLTFQERDAAESGGQAPNASINHVLAAGTGQNVLNEGALRFTDGAALVAANAAAAVHPAGNAAARRAVLAGLAAQAAAVGRQQGYSRAILRERHGEALPNNPANRRIYGNAQAGANLDVGTSRNHALRHTLAAFQGPTAAARFRAYKDVLRMTFDSPGNLRVGDAYGNNLASTGFDMPLDAAGNPTPRGLRLAAAHSSYAPDRLLVPARRYTVTPGGAAVSSSMYAPPGARVGPGRRPRAARRDDGPAPRRRRIG